MIETSLWERENRPVLYDREQPVSFIPMRHCLRGIDGSIGSDDNDEIMTEPLTWEQASQRVKAIFKGSICSGMQLQREQLPRASAALEFLRKLPESDMVNLRVRYLEEALRPYAS